MCAFHEGRGPDIEGARRWTTPESEPIDLEPGQTPEEADQKRSNELRGDQLTEQEFKERAEHIKELRLAIDAWKEANVPENEAFDNKHLIALLEHLSTEHEGTIDRITEHFIDREKYPHNRQVIKLRMREVGKVPDVFLFGWRGEDDLGETKIHDHADSTVAIKVHQGQVEEKVWRIDREEWLRRKPGQKMTCFGPPNQKRYDQGAHKSYKSPFVHAVSGTPENKLAVTLHAYWRPSEEASCDFIVEGDEFIEVGKN